MRFHRLTITGVGPFRGRQEVDFDAVSASGLFLIEGPTGAGKTTIIDAIVFALYGSLSGADSDPGRLRSHLCATGEPTEVTLEFSVGGVRHTITRNPAYERRKSRGEGTTLERAAQTLRVHDDATPDMREAKEIGVYLAQRIGLTVDQFRRLVVLPQGEFDTLLQAKPIDRYRTIAGLIDDGFLQRVQEDLKQRADEALHLRRDAGTEVERLLDVMRERASEVVEIPDEFDPEAIMAAIAVEAAAATAVAEQTSATLHARQAAEHAAQARAEACRAASEARTALARAAAAVGPEASTFDDAEVQAAAREVVAQRTRLEPLAEWETRAEERAQESARRRATADALAQRITDARTEAASLPARLQSAEATLDEARLLASRADLLAADVDRLRILQETAKERVALEDSVTSAREQERGYSDGLQAARNALQAARTAHHDLVRTQLAQRAAHLAALLVDGDACPVCGSADHPDPAHASDGALVSDTQVAQAEHAAAAAESAEKSAAVAHETSRTRLASLDQELAVAVARLEGATGESITDDLAAAALALEEARAAATSVPSLVEAVQGLSAQLSTSAAAVEGLIAEEATARAEASAYDTTVADEESRHREQVGATGSAAELLAAANARLTALEALQQARSAAAGLPLEDDAQAAQDACAQAEAERLQAQAAHTVADERRLRLADAHAALTVQAGELTAARATLDSVGNTTAAAVHLGSLVTAARGSANLRNLTLQAYAVQRRFRSVLEAASVHLERMSSGKFAFALDETTSGGAQAGLGIDVVDSWSGQARDPGTLSGGERFYASLSLALGLADIVREESGGVSLDTLFVDEGFGSLDADTLTVVLDQLDALRSRGRVVGVISHVTEMKEWVHDRIVVEAGPPGAGSRVTQSA
jgi:exonuclease SbcC